MGGDGPRATPTWHDGRVYALGAEGELRCLDDKTGRAVWSKNILRENGASNLEWGMSAAPLIVDNAVVVLPGGRENKSVVAYDKGTGQTLWTALDDKQAYVSPMLVTLAGERQILVVTAKRAVGLTTDGKLLWEYPWITEYDVNASQPLIAGPDSLILSAGYGHGAARVRVSKSGDAWKADTLWQNTRMKNKFTSSVLHDGYVYGLDEAILACIDANTGDLKWKGGRYGYGQVVLASGHVIVTTEDGDVALVRATPDRHDELVRFSAISGKTWNHPAIANGTLIVRNNVEMSGFRIR
jgi:outer membrane protein assembly factor BamB